MKFTRTKGIGIGIAVLALAGITWWATTAGPKGPDYSKKYDIVGRDHIAFGAPHTPYNSDPPSSGPHYETPSPVGFFHQEIGDETLIHNLEHGDIWIAYNPRVAQTIKDQLSTLVSSDDKLIITPRTRNEFDISLVAWGRVDSFNVSSTTLDLNRITTFIARYRDKAPERVTQPKAN